MTTKDFVISPYLQTIANHLNNNLKTNTELEIRITTFGYNENDKNSLARQMLQFLNLKYYLESNFGPPEEYYMTDLRSDDSDQVRQTIEIDKETGEEKIYNIVKEPLFDSVKYDISNNGSSVLKNEYGLKLALSKETKKTYTDDRIKNPKITRVKHRYSWVIEKANIRYDLTEVNQIEKGQPNKEFYEVEIENLDPIFNERKSKITGEYAEYFKKAMFVFNKFILATLSEFQMSDTYYNFSQQREISEFFNNATKAKEYVNFKNMKQRTKMGDKGFVYFPKPGEMANEIVVQARPLKKFDMVSGGLMFGSIKYTVTPKAEGVRKFLVIHKTGVWLVFPNGPKSSYCLVYRNDHPEFVNWKPYINSIFDGEDIPKDNQFDQHRKGNYNNVSHYYIPFDTLIFKDIDIRDDKNLTLFDRQKYFSLIKKISNTDRLIIVEKPFYKLGDNMETMYETINKVLSQNPDLEYETDGLIFTPYNSSYNPRTDILVPKRSRNLVDYPDICKWKPLDKISIDVKVKPSLHKVYSSKGAEDVEFIGSQWNSFDPETQIDWNDNLFNTIKTDNIVEFGLKLDPDGNPVSDENGNIILKPFRIRYDKQFANGVATVEDNYGEMNDPVTTDTLLGKDIKLYRQYHNRVKREVLTNREKVPDGSHLIDIGSGRGGDLNKLSKFSKVLMIEPYAPFLEELEKRLTQFPENVKSKVTTLQAGGQESQRILLKAKDVFGEEFGKKPLCISMMLSMSFFWQSTNFLYQLVNTINMISEAYYNAGGKEGSLYFLFMTIEGERTLKLLTENDNSVTLNGATISYFPEQEKVYINIPGTIVERQEEYLVNLVQFRNLTNMDVVYEKEANGENFLSENEKIFTSLYVYGQYIIKKSDVVIYDVVPETQVFQLKEDLIIEDKNLEPVENIVTLVPETVESYYIPQESNSTLFEAIIKYFNPDVDSIDIEDVITYRKNIALAIKDKNPYDVKDRSIFTSAGNGYLKKTFKTKNEAIQWIFSNYEFKPEEISWIPDLIGFYISVNGVVNYTSELNEDINTINLKYENDHYMLILK